MPRMSDGETSETTAAPAEHGGKLIARRLEAAGVSKLFTLSGGHIFPIYDGCRERGIDIIDVRHEQTAAFAAEGWAKVTREPGVCALTAGPGVTNGMSAITGALRERVADARPRRPGAGLSLGPGFAAGDRPRAVHVPGHATRRDGRIDRRDPSTRRSRARRGACGPPGGRRSSTCRWTSSSWRARSRGAVRGARPVVAPAADGSLIDRAAALLAGAERPVVMAGTGLYWGHGENELLKLSEELGVPVFLNGLGRGCLPADHPHFFARARSTALKGADVALVIGAQLDFRLGFGGSFGDDTELIAAQFVAPEQAHRASDRRRAGRRDRCLAGRAALRRRRVHRLASRLDRAAARRRDREARGRGRRACRRRARRCTPSASTPSSPRCSTATPRSSATAATSCSYAGKYIDTYEPGCWMDPGPYGCLGTGPGYAMAAALAKPGKQVVMMMGDGAFGFAGMDFDSLVRHNIPAVAVIGNNGIWALEKHPMEFLYGYSVAAELTPGMRYDKIAETLGGHGEFVETPDELRPALERAFESGKPAVVNVLDRPCGGLSAQRESRLISGLLRRPWLGSTCRSSRRRRRVRRTPPGPAQHSRNSSHLRSDRQDGSCTS